MKILKIIGWIISLAILTAIWIANSFFIACEAFYPFNILNDNEMLLFGLIFISILGIESITFLIILEKMKGVRR